MSTITKSGVFLAVAFAISWAIAIGGHVAGLSQTPSTAMPVLALMMAGPAISALICTIAFERGRRVEALGRWESPLLWLRSCSAGPRWKLNLPERDDADEGVFSPS